MPPCGRAKAVKYTEASTLMSDLRRRVGAYFDDNGIDRCGGWRMLLKSGVILSWAVGSYLALLLWADAWWVIGLLAVSLALALAAIGFSIQHDGGHGSYSSNRSVSRAAAWTLDLVGGSSYMWRHKHNILHHTYPNVEGADDDISQMPWLRLCTTDPRLPMHRHQHWYAWFLYSLLAPRWIFIDDFKRIRTQRAGARRVQAPQGRSLAFLFVGKALAFTWILVLPLALHGLSLGLLAVYFIVSWVWGATLATAFQLAHCNTSADFVEWPRPGKGLELAWAEQQLATTVNFSPKNSLLTWYIGGLNYQVEHHLFPRICHLHYPAIRPIVRDVCREHGVRYREHATFWDALAAHVDHLRRLGRAPVEHGPTAS